MLYFLSKRNFLAAGGANFHPITQEKAASSRPLVYTFSLFLA